MAKLLYFGVPGHGHVNPTLPVMAELVRQGHQLLHYNAESFRMPALRSGAEFRSYPDSGALASLFTQSAGDLVAVSLFLLEESLRLLPFVLQEIEREDPQLVMFDSLALWGMQGARLRRRPSVASITTLVQEGVAGALSWRDLLPLVGQALPRVPAIFGRRRELVRRYGPGVFPYDSIFPCRGDRNIVYTSRLFQPESTVIDESFHFVGPSISVATRPQSEFPWHLLDSSRPCIYLSLGTIHSDNDAFYRIAFDAFAKQPGQYVFSAGSQIDLAALGPLPENVIVRPNIPQLELLPKCCVFVTHGGMNSVQESLYFGVPMVVVPQQSEQRFNGRQVVRHGAGLLLEGTLWQGRTDAVTLRRAVARVQAEGAFAVNAEKVGRSLREAGGYGKAAAVVLSALR
jgi:MGT family glycosyltransferase